MPDYGPGWTPRDALAEALCNQERGRRGVGYFIRHGDQADALLAALQADGFELVRRSPVSADDGDHE